MGKLSILLIIVCLLSLSGCISTQYKTVTTGAPGVTKYLTTITETGVGGTHTVTNTQTNTATVTDKTTITQTLPTTILTTVVMPPVTLPATTITVTTTLPPTTAAPTLANSVSFSVNPPLASVTEKTAQQIINYNVHVANTSNVAFNLVKLTFTMQTQIPGGAIIHANNISLNTLGYLWTLGLVNGGIYTFTGPATYSIAANSTSDFSAALYLVWDNPPPIGTYVIQSNVTAS